MMGNGFLAADPARLSCELSCAESTSDSVVRLSPVRMLCYILGKDTPIQRYSLWRLAAFAFELLVVVRVRNAMFFGVCAGACFALA
jgi:hypothetical protein